MVSQTRPETNNDCPRRLPTKFQTSPFRRRRRRRRSIQVLETPPPGIISSSSAAGKTLHPDFPSSALKQPFHLLPPKKRVPVAAAAGDVAARQRMQQVVRLYRETLENLVRENNGKRTNELCLRAASLLDGKGEMVNTEKRLGSVPGVEVGDEFQFRGEMRVIGLHCQCFRGIDYLKARDGTKLATSVVASGRYFNFMKSSNVLVYSGQGGNPNVGDGRDKKNKDRRPEDQKLEKGNLALKNSMDSKTPVRVIRGLKSKNRKDQQQQDETQGNVIYVYDGLYFVKSSWMERGEFGKLVFKFELVRDPDQPNVIPMAGSKGGGGGEKNANKKAKKKEEIVQKDISEGKQEIAVAVVNAWDGERPAPFTYVLNNCCNGSSSRGSGRGSYPVQFQFEVFRTDDSNCWGLRSRQYISAGSFICEYTGEYREVKSKGGIRYHFDIGESSLSGRNGGGWFSIIDATRCGNLSRFINRSDHPNLVAKKVYDDGDWRVARVLIHAAKDIPPRREMTL